jgi:DNA gyrase subunit A
VGVALTDGKRDVMLFTDAGKVIRFKEDDVRAMGRTACGVRGIQLPDDASVIDLVIVGDGHILTVSERGYGKRCEIDEYPVQGRGGQGVRALDLTDKTGKVVAAIQVQNSDEIMLISSSGSLVRTGVNEISVMGRNTQGVVLKRVEEDERLVGVDRIAAEANGEGEE